MSRLSTAIYEIKFNQTKENKPTMNMTNEDFKNKMEELKQVDLSIRLMSEAVERQAYELVVSANELNRQVIDLLKEIKKYE